MKKYIPVFFLILGAADFVYGLWRGDRISLLIGGMIILIAVSMIRKARQEEKNNSFQKKQ